MPWCLNEGSMSNCTYDQNGVFLIAINLHLFPIGQSAATPRTPRAVCVASDFGDQDQQTGVTLTALASRTHEPQRESGENSFASDRSVPVIPARGLNASATTQSTEARGLVAIWPTRYMRSTTVFPRAEFVTPWECEGCRSREAVQGRQLH